MPSYEHWVSISVGTWIYYRRQSSIPLINIAATILQALSKLSKTPIGPKLLLRHDVTKPLVCDPGMHHGTCMTHVPWCMSGSLTCGGRENVPGIPDACATRNFTYLARGPWKLYWHWLQPLRKRPIVILLQGPVSLNNEKLCHIKRYIINSSSSEIKYIA